MNWCSNSTIYQKCCLTSQSKIYNINLVLLFLINSLFKDYQSKFKALPRQVYSTNCADLANEIDCQAKAAAGLCNSGTTDSQTVRYYCPKSCGLCSNSYSNNVLYNPTYPNYQTSLTCNGLTNPCNSGYCTTTSYYSVPSISCVCPSSCNCGGSYCHIRVLKYNLITLIYKKLKNY